MTGDFDVFIILFKVAEISHPNVPAPHDRRNSCITVLFHIGTDSYHGVSLLYITTFNTE